MKTCEELEVGDWVLHRGYELTKRQVTRVLKATFEVDGIVEKFNRRDGWLRGGSKFHRRYCIPWDEEKHAKGLAEQEAAKYRQALLNKLDRMAWHKRTTEQLQAVLDLIESFS